MKLSFDSALPITERRDDIADALRDHQVVVVAGETGSGKTTQLPKIALQTGRKRIAHTQPRRIAARSVARRIAQECEVELGTEVGYAVRFDDTSTPDTAVRLVTDGLLLAEINHDPELSRYDCIIIDEAHERTLSIDFLLGYLKRLLPRRPDLTVVITSATIDVERFGEMFDAPVIEVSGRTYPVEVRYRPPDSEDGMLDAISSAVDELPREGDILVFLSGEREIRDAADVLAGRKLSRTEILPLYGRLSTQDQQKIFSSHTGRRIVLATNVAETSLTVPGIRYVIDTGYARISRYSQRLKVQRLPIEPISQASAAQRAGRCGRVADGICIRLYAEDDHDARPEFTDPEIQRTNLASVLLQMASQDLGDIDEFPFLDPPDSRAVSDGLNLLRELGALTRRRGGGPGPGAAQDTDRLTRLGRAMAGLPLDPRMARMLLAADRQGCLADVLVVVSALSIQDPRERPLEQTQAADAKHARFRQPDSDFLSYLTLWTYLQEKRRELSGNAFRRMCKEEFLHHLRIREWQDVHAQLRRTAKELGMRPGKLGADPDDVHRALLTGLLSHIGLREADGKEYLGARGAKFMVFPGSGLAKKPPRWIVAGELVETSRLWGRDVAKVEPAWIEQAATHLVKRQYAEPHWSSRRGAAMAKERVTLYGVPLVADRLVPLSRSDAALARELFIRHALVDGEWRTQHSFWHENQRMLADSEEVEDRVRRRGLRVDDETLFAFYDGRVPADVVSVRHFDSWWKKTRQQQPDLLTFDPALVAVDVERLDEDFPTTWSSESSDYTVSYAFEPGTESDGVTLDVPLDDLLTLDAREFVWNVPGHRIELVTELIRSLPKPLRRQLVPAPQRAQELVAAMDPAANDLTAELVRQIGRRTEARVSADDFDLTAIPAHLRVVFRVLDTDGAELARGRDLDVLRQQLEPQLRRDLDRAAAQEEQTGLTSWTVGTIEPVLRAGQVDGFPALVDEGSTVALRVLRTQVEQDVAMVRGQARLLSLLLPTTTPRIGKALDMRQKLTLAAAPYRDPAAVIDDARLAALDDLVARHGAAWDEAGFDTLRETVRPDVHEVTESVVLDVVRTLEALADVSPGDDEAGEDVRAQVSWLVFEGFVREVGRAQLRRLPVYLRAARRRLDNPTAPPAHDVQDLEAELHEITEGWSPLRRLAPDVQQARWALEELRVSLYAQNLRTAHPVSHKRVRAMLDSLQNG
ncbi:ATP-dependent RNA helicase HrpA [Aeromicrobium sp. CTD01-1L150]|uniref:ATP-dependent RNA helicase HrpA n=1 Tax=Aeromicrobium sp. CTD01-1L150 TaxID=3341830 RepID=UPI0035BEC1AE